MALFESLVLLLFVSALLMLGARRLAIPYPTLLCVAGAAVTLLPFAPHVAIEPQLALALFVAPALLDAAFDTSPRALRRLWVPLVALALGAVLATAATVSVVGWSLGGLPVAAAIALGAIVAPPDAVAANAVLSQVGFPRRSTLLLQGESLLNDATALIIFGAATAAVAGTGTDGEMIRLGLAAPGGVLLGLAMALVVPRLRRLFAGTLTGTLVEFTATFGTWLIAEHLEVSPVLAVVAFAMLLARHAPGRTSARDRVQSYAVWGAAVFVLNVLAFLLMGLQTRAILADFAPGELAHAVAFAGAVLVAVIAVRIVTVLGFRGLTGWLWRSGRRSGLVDPPPWRVAFLVSWCGMRGLLTLATAFALPYDFPGRNLVVLTAFTVVLGTLVLQGLTLKPLMLWLAVGDDHDMLASEIGRARRQMLAAGLDAAAREPEPVAALLRTTLHAASEVAGSPDDPQGATAFDTGLAHVVAAQRDALNRLRHAGEVADDVFQRLEQELDWLELAARPSRELEMRET